MLPLLKSRSKLSLEMIDFQSDNFGLDMQAIYTSLHDNILKNTYSTVKQIELSTEVKSLKELIFKRLGLKVDVVTDSALAAILPFYSNKNHIFIDNLFRGNFTIREQQKILNDANKKTGTVNSHKAKVSGIFSEYENVLYLNFQQLFRTHNLTPSEVTAVTLHELGHAFYACEYADRLESTNQVLAAVAEELLSKKDKKDMVYIYRELEKVNPDITEEEVDNLINGNRVIAGCTWFKVVVGLVDSQMTNAKYDDTSFEQLADNFAARFGYGREILLALDKISVNYYDPAKSRSMMVFWNILSLIIFLGQIAITVFAAVSGMIPLTLYLALLVFINLRVRGEDIKDYTYDDLKIRYKRIRNECVEMLKTLKLSNEKLASVLKDIELMDRVIQNTHNYRAPLNAIANFVFKGARDANRSIQEQKLVEEFIFNDLFVKSAQIKVA